MTWNALLGKDAAVEALGTRLWTPAQSRGNLAMSITVPARMPLKQSGKVVSPVLAMFQQLCAKSQNLRRTRDLLLTRLLSGQTRS